MNDFARHGVQHRAGCFQRVGLTADHERQRSGGSPLHPAGDRGIELGETPFDGVGMHGAGIVNGDCRAVDEQRTRCGGGHHLGVTLANKGPVGQHRDDDAGVPNRLGCGFTDAHTGVGGGGPGGGHRIEALHLIAGLGQVGAHRCAHVSQA